MSTQNSGRSGHKALNHTDPSGSALTESQGRGSALHGLTGDQFAVDFAADVRRDLRLTPKQLQSKYLYDALGSSLFEAICRLPWYAITRSETRLLESHACEIVSRALHHRSTIVELGCGSGEKLVILA